MSSYESSPEYKYLDSLQCFQVPDTCCSDGCACFYGIFAYPCVQGLMMQQARKGDMKKEDAGCCGKICWSESAFPCVCTDYCWGVCCYNAIVGQAGGDSLPGRALARGAQAGVQSGVRSTLIGQAGGKADGWHSFLQTFLPCYCVNFNDAAYVMAKKKQEGGTDPTKNTEIGGLAF